MRDILYRAKKLTGEWVEGNLIKLKTDRVNINYMYYIIPEITNGSWCKQNFALKFISPCYEIDHSTICQYTGLTDKNGKKIWENDIVKTNHGYIGIIRFGQYEITHYGFYIEWINGDEALRTDLLYWLPKIKRIGNIFDNPELLEGGAE